MDVVEHGCELRSHPLVLTPGRESEVTEETHSSQSTVQEEEGACEASSKPAVVPEWKAEATSWNDPALGKERKCRSDSEGEKAAKKKFELVDRTEKLREWRQLKYGKRAGSENERLGERTYRCERIRSIAKERAETLESGAPENKELLIESSPNSGREAVSNKCLRTPKKTGQLSETQGINGGLVEPDEQGPLSGSNPDAVDNESNIYDQHPCGSGRMDASCRSQGKTALQAEASENLSEPPEGEDHSKRREELDEKERALAFVEQELLEADIRLQEQAKDQRDNKVKLDSLQLQIEEESKALNAERKELEEKQRKLVIFEQELILREKQLVERETKMAATDENLTRWIEEMSEVASQDTPRRLGRSPLAPDSQRVPMTERKVPDQEGNGSDRNWPLSDRKPRTLKSFERPLDRIKRDISLQF